MSEQNSQNSSYPQYGQSNNSERYENKDHGKGLATFSYIFLAVAVVAAVILVIAFEYPGFF